MSFFTLTSLLIFSVGLVFCVAGFRRLFKRQWLKGTVAGFSGSVLLAISVLTLLLSSNLYTYQRLVFESPVAEISFKQLAREKFFVALLNSETGIVTEYEVLGNEWQLDAQILSWRGYANLLGLDPYFRLHRLSGRYTDIDKERGLPHSVYSLAEEQNVDFWQLVHQYQDWIQLVDAMYGSAVFLPMTDQASYVISINRNGLIARPDNAEAKKAVSRWIGL